MEDSVNRTETFRLYNSGQRGVEMFRILVVDDDPQINRSVCLYLEQYGYDAVGCLNVNDALDVMFEKPCDLVISDIMMPGTDGFAFARMIRKEDEEIPILFMTARDDFTSKKKGFREGIDDYMVKPVDLDELLLRIEALLRRANINSKKKLTVGNVVLDANEHTAYIGEEEVSLTVREFDILFKLLSNPRRTFTRGQLMDEFWDSGADSSTRTVDVYMTRIRAKFAKTDAFEIRTVHGLGYKAVIRDA